MSEKDIPHEQTPDDTELFNAITSEFGSDDELVVSGEQYAESMRGFYDSFAHMIDEPTLASCYATLKEIENSSAFFKYNAREMISELDGTKRADALVNTLIELDATCAMAVNNSQKTKFENKVNENQIKITRMKLIRLDDGGNLPICTEAAKVHANIQKKYAYLLASEIGLGKEFRLAKMVPKVGKATTGALGIIGKLRK